MEKGLNKNLPLQDLLDTVEKNIQILRNKLRDQADKIIEDVPPMGVLISGNIYIESIESLVEFDEYGNFEYLYTPDSLKLRTPGLSESEKSRELIFFDIAKQLPSNSRVLNIGAGGDIIIPICMEKSDHEVISTDFSQSTVDILSKNINSPVFACDLLYIDEVLPEDSIDFLLGNSTLGYVDPKKLRKVVSNLSKIMKNGGIFTFDLAPHPVYFHLIDQKPHQTVANESEVDPTKLIDFVDQFGKHHGINAMAFYNFYRSHYTNISVLFLIKELFEKEGLSCFISYQELALEHGSKKIQLSLRVSKNYPSILNCIKNEIELTIESATKVFNDDKIWYRLAMIDRKNAQVLAKQFGIHTNKRDVAWNVIYYINQHLSAMELPSSIKNEVLQQISITNLIEKFRPFLYGKNIPKQLPLPQEIIADQTIHKMVIEGTTDMSPEEADEKIDFIYLKAMERKRLREQKKQKAEKFYASKRKRKQSRKSRQKNR